MAKGIRGQTLEERIMDKVNIDTSTDCWHFTGAKNNVGYGMIRKSKQDGMATAHKAMYELKNYCVVPDDLVVMHTCTSYDCVNPDHLTMTTRKQVSSLMKQRGRITGFGATGPLYGNCKYCGLHASTAMLARWHNNKCKKKPIA